MLNTAGLKIGHATDEEMNTGCTFFLCPDGTVGGVDIRGMAPGSRETALLNPIKSVPNVNGIMMTGGSAFGLATADGAMRWLSEHDIGHYTPIRRVPIVPTAVLFDLFINGGQRPPDAEMGYAACEAAAANGENLIEQGNVGAGAGITVGKWSGFENIMKGGFGVASVAVKGVVVFAAAAVNAVGDVINEDGTVLAGARNLETGGWMVEENRLRIFPERPPANMTNTTLVVVATTAALTKVEANRLAQRAHDGMAIAIRPVHTMHDGDTAFALSTGKVADVPFDMVGNAAVHVVAEAIRNSVRFAKTTKGIVGLGG